MWARKIHHSKTEDQIFFAQINHELTAKHYPEVNLDTISYGSNKKLWWNCEKDSQHVWDAGIKHRAVAGTGCPFCSGNQVMAGNNDLEFLNSELASQWHPTKNGELLPSHVTVASTKKVWWLCSTDSRHEWETSIKTRNRGRGCPVCSSNMLITGINDLATTNPKLASEWNHELNYPLTPSSIGRSANRKAWWTCPEDESHVYQASINSRDNKKTGCPVCASRIIVKGFNDAATYYPELAEEWHPTLNGDLKWTEVSSTSHKKVWWVCKANSEHSWRTRISSRTLLRSGCQVCNSRLFVSGLNDLATDNPELARQWHSSLNNGITPDSVIRFSVEKYWWQCPKDQTHIWQAPVVSRNKNRTGCPKCIVYKTENEFRNLFNRMSDLEFIDGRVPVQWSKRNFTQIDILNEVSKICIEYDGLSSHGGGWMCQFSAEECLDRDVLKTDALLAAGYLVVRIRAIGLPPVPILNERFFQISFKEMEDKNPIVERCIEFYESLL